MQEPNNNAFNNLDLSELNFAHSWRPEQQKVLSRLESYLDDRKVHIVAAPGAGKTVLGLEVFKRLGLKTLVFSPTVVVKDQWLERLSSFTPCGSSPAWNSTSLITPSHFTSSTYQALYSFDKRLNKAVNSNSDQSEEAFTDLKQWFEFHNFGLIILDEAHHLKASWWKVLYELVKDNQNLIIVSLTATPPYDSNTTEWSRYKKLCGPVDEEISIPELVKSGSLCPHQDYIWLVKTDEKNIASLERYENKLSNFLAELSANQELFYLLQLHDFLHEFYHTGEASEKLNERDVLLNLEVVIALLSLLKHWGTPLPKYLMSMLNINEDDIQSLTMQSWEHLLDSFLKGDYYPNVEVIEDFRETLTALLKSRHYLKYSRVRFDNTLDKLDAFNKTEERITACFDVAQLEIENRRSLLRMVVLTDYIRDEELTLGMDGRGASAGAYPIFHYFIHHLDKSMLGKTALLTGRLSILPASLWGKLVELAPSDAGLSTKLYQEHADFVICIGESSHLTSAYTELLKLGELEIIIGTRGLLGEGWDAPFLNALIMATQTKAYVATNQLRGRVMRIDPEDDLKTASIWHIVATAPEQRLNGMIFDNIKKRFRTFAGLHAYDLKIESGTDRLALSTEGEKESQQGVNASRLSINEHNIIQLNNQEMRNRVKDDLFNLQARWQNALAQAKHQVFQVGLHYKANKGSELYSLERLQFSVNQFIKQKNKRYLIKHKLLSRAILGGGLTGLAASVATLFWFKFTAYALGGLCLMALLYAVGTKLLKRQPLDKALTTRTIGLKVARIVLLSLHNTGQMKTKLYANELLELINVDYVDEGGVRFSLNNYSRQENEYFLEALNELLQPLSSTRYLLALTENPDIQHLYSIPKIVGNKKQHAEYFLAEWRKEFPEFKQANILLAGSQQGAKSLLKASAKRLLSTPERELPLQMIERWE